MLLCGLLLLLGLSTTSVMAQDLPEGIEKVTTVEGITEYQLDNGLKVLLFPDQTKPQITVNITYLVGSRHEGYGETGMAHLLEHMVFKGTPNHPDIPAELSSHGAQPNGTTWYDRTNYYETFTANEENLRWALDLEADRMINSYVAAEDLESEMTVVRNEFEMGENSPSGILNERVMSTMFLWHNYGQSTIGARADLENVPIERLQAFYKKYYQPDNAVLTVAGKIDEMETLEMIKEYFGPIPKPTRKLFNTYTRDPVQDGERLVTLERVGEVQVVSAGYHIPPGTHPDYYAIEVLTEVLSNEPSGRLYQALVETGKASSQYGYCFGLKEPGVIYFGADVLKEKSLEEAKMALLDVLDNMKDNPVTQEEVDRAKTSILKQFELQFNDSRVVGLYLSEFIAKGDWRLGFLFRDEIEQVTAEDVQRVAEYYLKPSNRTVGMFYPTQKPDRVEIPEVEDVSALVANYKGREVADQGEAFDASPANIDERSNRYAAASGIKYILLSKENRGNAVTGRLFLRFGDAEALEGLSAVSDLTAAMLNKGSQNRSRQEIKDAFDQLKANVSFGGGGTAVSVSIDTEGPNLLEVIDLIGEVLKTASFPEEEFKKLVEENLASLEESSADPMSIASREFGRLVSPFDDPDHVRYTPTFEEEIAALKAVTIDDIKSFYENFYGASDATFSIVGDFDETAVRNKIDEVFGDWKSPQPYARIPTPFEATDGTEKVVETPDKANAMFFGGLRMPINDSHPDYAALTMANYMFGGGFLNSRLATRLRQQDGVSYAAGSGLNAHPTDESALMYIYAIFAPENKEKVEIGVKEEMERVVAEGYTQEELDAAKSGWLQNRSVNRSEDGSLVGTLSSHLFFDRTMQYDADLEAQVESLTLDQVNGAVAKYFDYSKLVAAKAGDFEGAKAKMEAAQNAEPVDMDASMTAEDVLDNYITSIGGKDKVAAIEGVKMVLKGKVQGTDMTMTNLQNAQGQLSMEIAMGGMVAQKVVFDGENASVTAGGQTTAMPAEEIESMKYSKIIPELHYGEMGATVELEGVELVGDVNAYKVKVTLPNGETKTSFYAIDSFLKIREVEASAGGEEVTDLGEYAEVNGVLFPHEFSISGALPIPLNLKADSIDVNPTFSADAFKVE